MRIRKLSLVLVLLATALGIAQSPNDAKVTATSYENSYFKFSYTWPRNLRPFPIGSLDILPGPSVNEYPLFSARQGEEPYGVIVMAERLNGITPHTRGFRDGADLLDKLARFRPEQHAVILSRKHFINESGIVVDVLDYSNNGEPASAVVARIGKFLIVFRCNAKSGAELEEMDRSAIALKPVR